MLREERLDHVAPRLQCRVAVEPERPERGAVAVDAAVPPRPEHHEDEFVVLILRLEGGVDVYAAVHVLLVPEARHEQCRDRELLCRENLIECLTTPELVVGRVLAELLEERQQIDAEVMREAACGNQVQEQLVVIEGAAWDLLPFAVAGGLSVDVVEVALTEGTVVKPVIPLPSIDHRALGNR